MAEGYIAKGKQSKLNIHIKVRCSPLDHRYKIYDEKL